MITKDTLINKTTDLMSGYLESAGVDVLTDNDKNELRAFFKEFVDSRSDRNKFDEPTINFTLRDPCDYTKILPCKMSLLSTAAYIQPAGYGEQSSEDNEGYPIGIEFYEDRFRVMAWNDINEADPVIIDMENARESNRRGD